MTSTPLPIVVMAAPFCGATYVAAVLGRHPDLYAVPQLDLWMSDTVAGWLEIFEIGQGTQSDGLLRTLAELEFGSQTDATIAAATGWLQERAEWSTAALFDYLMQRVAPRRLVVPDVEAPMRPHDLWRLHAAVPQAQILGVVRHPMAACLDHAAWLQGRLFVPADFKDHSQDPPQIEPQLGWFRAYCNLQTRWDGASPTMLRIEDVDVDQPQSLRALCSALGLPADDAVLKAMAHPEAWVFGSYGPRSAPYGLEPDLLEPIRLPKRWPLEIRLDASPPWRKDDRPLSPDLVALARRYGYS